MSYAPIDAPSLNRASNSRDNSLLSSTSSFAQNSSKRTNGHRRRLHRSGHDHPIIVHSHLSWDWVWQRPQQFLSRLSNRHRVLFIETLPPTPDLVCPRAEFKRIPEYPNLIVLKLTFPTWRWNDGAWVDDERRRLVQTALDGPLAGQ